ncbi:sensor histidine kinase [Gordonia crocea]|nr:histidine kinase [Gordonia crocea]
MGWLFERYRLMFAKLGYDYPPRYMLIADLGQAFFCLFAVGQRLVSGPTGWQWAALGGAVALCFSPIVASVVHPHKIVVGLLSGYYIGAVILFWLVPVHGDVSPLLLVVGATMLAAVMPFRPAWLFSLLFAATAAGGAVAGVVDQGGLIVLMVGFGTCVGQLLQQQLKAMEAEHQARSRQQVVERAGIAGEVHDVVAHSLSIVLLNVTAARRALEAGRDEDGVVAAGDVDEAVEALRDAETQGREAMGDVRRTIELLRSDGTPDTAQPGLADLDRLVAGFRRAGSQIRYRFDPPAANLTSATELAVYRVVQESLSNACRHVPGVAVAVGVGPREAGGFGVRVTNPAGSKSSGRGGSGLGGSGLGVSGMRSRVENLGGEFRAGVVDGQWVVDAVFAAVPTTDSVCAKIEGVLGGR